MFNIVILKALIYIYVNRSKDKTKDYKIKKYIYKIFNDKLNKILNNIDNIDKKEIEKKLYNKMFQIEKKEQHFYKNLISLNNKIKNINIECNYNFNLEIDYNKYIRSNFNYNHNFQKKDYIKINQNFYFYKNHMYEILYIYKYKKIESNKIIYTYIPSIPFNITTQQHIQQLEDIRFFLYNFIDFSKNIVFKIILEGKIKEEDEYKNTYIQNKSQSLENNHLFKDLNYLYKTLYKLLDIYEVNYSNNLYIVKIDIHFNYKKDIQNEYIKYMKKTIQKYANYYTKKLNKHIKLLYKRDLKKELYIFNIHNNFNFNKVTHNVINIYNIFIARKLFLNINNKLIYIKLNNKLIKIKNNYIIYYEILNKLYTPFMYKYKLKNVSYNLKLMINSNRNFYNNKRYNIIKNFIQIIKK